MDQPEPLGRQARIRAGIAFAQSEEVQQKLLTMDSPLEAIAQDVATVLKVATFTRGDDVFVGAGGDANHREREAIIRALVALEFLGYRIEPAGPSPP